MPGKFWNAEKRRPEVEVRVENWTFLRPEFRKWMVFWSISDAKFAISGGPKNVFFFENFEKSPNDSKMLEKVKLA